MQADGRVVIDTKINTDGVVAGEAEMKKAFKQMAGSLSQMKKTGKDAVQQQAASFAKLNEQAAEFENKKAPTQEYLEIQKQIDEARSKLDALIDHQQKFIELGGDRTSETYRSMQERIDELTNSIRYAESEMADLAATGKAVTLGSSTAYGTAAVNLQPEVQPQRPFDRLSGAFDRLKAKIAEYRQSLAGASSYTGMLDSAIGGLGVAVQGLGTALRRLPLAALKAGIVGLRKGFSALGTILKKVAKEAQRAALSLAQMVGKGLIGGLKKLSAGIFGLGKKAKQSGRSLGGMLANSLLMGGAFMAVFAAIRSLGEGMNHLSQFSDKTNTTLSELKAGLEQLKNSFATAFSPILSTIAPALNTLINMLVSATTAVAQFMAAITGQGTFTKAVKVQQNYAAGLKNTGKAAAQAGKDAKKALAPFDDLVQIQKQNETTSGGGSGEIAPSQMFEEVPIDQALSNFADSLRKMFSEGNWAGIGQLIGTKINEAVESFTQFISWDRIGAQITSFVTAFTTVFNSLVGTVDWYSIGIMLGTGIDTIANTLYLLLTQIDWQMLGNALSQGVNGIVNTVDWQLFGSTIGAYFQARLSALYGFVSGVDWAGIGQAVGEALNGIAEQIDWQMLGRYFAEGLSGAFHTLASLASTFDWAGFGSSLASSLSEFFQVFDWAGAGSAISDIVIGILDALINFIIKTDWWAFGEGVATALENINWSEVANRLFMAIGAALGGLAALLGGLLSDAVESAQTYFQEKIEECGGNIVSGILKGIVDGIKGIAGWIGENVFTPFINGFKEVFGIASPSKVMGEMGGYLMDGLLNRISEEVPGVVNEFDELKTGIGAKWDEVKNSTESTWELMRNSIAAKTGGISQGISDFSVSVKEKWSNWLQKISGDATTDFEAMRKFISLTTDKIKNALSIFTISSTEVWGNWLNEIQGSSAEKWELIQTEIFEKAGKIRDHVSEMLTLIKLQWDEKWEQIQEKTEDIWEAILNTIKGTINGIVSEIENLINRVVDLLNGLIHQINKIHIDVPETPFSDGFTIGFNIPDLGNVHLPRLAQGTVIPPRTGEFAAILGDNNREAEVVSPISAMKQAFLEALAESDNSGAQTITLRFDGSMSALARVLKPELDREAARKGTNLVIVGGR